MTKTCTGCRQELPATTEHFPRRRATKKDGLAYRCHACNRAAVCAAEAKRRAREVSDIACDPAITH